MADSEEKVESQPWGEVLVDPWPEDEEPISDDQTSVTITFGDQAENHVGMQKIGTEAERGLTKKDLTKALKKFQKMGGKGWVLRLNDFLPPGKKAKKAYILVLRDAVAVFGLDAETTYQEQTSLEWDKKAKMYGKVVNKHARHNLCFGDFDQSPDYENGKGRVVNFTHVPLLKNFHSQVEDLFGKVARNLAAEGNHYYDLQRCGIGFHGDAERKIVVALKLGAASCLEFQWFLRNKPTGGRLRIEFSGGDCYAFSEKATGRDWKSSSFPTLRHAAGCEKFTGV